MKKSLSRFLCLVLAMVLVCATALAADTTLMAYDEANNDYPNLYSMAAVGDTLYYVRSLPRDEQQENNLLQGLYRWSAGMSEPEKLAEVLSCDTFSSQEGLESVAVEGQDTAHALWQLFSDGERLMTVNPYTGKVFAVEAGNDGLTYTDLATIDPSSLREGDEEVDGYSYINTPDSIAAVGSKLCMLTVTYTERGAERVLHIFDLNDGSEKTSAVKNVVNLSSYKDGKLLAYVWDQDNAWDQETQTMKPGELGAYDPVADTFTTLCTSPTTTTRVAYDTKSGLLLYYDNNAIMGANAQGEAQQVGYAPLNYVEKMAVLDGSVALYDYNGLYIRTVSMSFNAAQSLKVYGSWMDDGQRLFVSRHPDVPVYNVDGGYSTTEALSQAMVSGESGLDILQLSVAWQSFTTLRDKGYCADLSASSALMEAVSKMQPCVRDQVMKDGKLYGIPVSCYAWGYIVNPSVLSDIGMTMDDMPTNYVELCQFLTDWNDEYADEFPNVNPIDNMNDLKKTLFNRMMEDYLGWCQATGQAVSFDTPVFRQLMDAYEKLRVDDITVDMSDMSDNDDYWYRDSLLNSYGTLAGSFSSYTSEYETVLPFTLTPDTDYTVGLDLSVMFVNPRTANLALATELLECMVESYDNDTRYTLMTDAAEPVLNPNYDQMVKSNREWLEQLQAQLETADAADKKDLESQLEWAQQAIDQQEQYRYSISAEQIAYFRETIEPALYVKLPTFLNATKDDASSELNTLIQRYVDGQIALEQFIHDADKKMRMIQMEDY